VIAWTSRGCAERGERQAESVVTQHTLAMQAQAFILRSLLRLGETEPVEQALADMDPNERALGDTRIVLAGLRLAQGDPEAASVTLAPVITVPAAR
jgi:LuxR family maltose regulon positive regulatory protein